MKLGVRGRLFGVSLIVIVGVGLLTGVLLERQLVEWLEGRIEESLDQRAATAREMVVAVGEPSGEGARADIAALDALADRLGQAAGARVTLIAVDGRVLGDSEVATDAVESLDNHAARPEVRRALAGGRGRSVRHSATLRADMLYVAIPVHAAPGGPRVSPSPAAVLRVATPLTEVAAATDRLRLAILGAGAIGLILAVLMSGLASHVLSRALRQLVASVRDLVPGERNRVRVASDDELGAIAGTVNRLASELEQGVANLAVERDRFETVVEGLADAVMAFDASLCLTLANPAAKRLLGLGEESAVGTSLLEAVRSPDLADLVTRGREAPAEAEIELPGPARRRVYAWAAPLPARVGGSRHCLLALRDVTEVRRLETVRRDFVANVSHELRTPVTVISTTAETLLSGALDDKRHARGFVESIHRNSARLAELIADLLDLSRLEAGREELRNEPVPVRTIARRVSDAVQERARASRQTVSLDLDEAIAVSADPKALEQVLSNLIENAVRYAPAGGRIAVAARLVESNVEIEVRDDGPGIEPRHRDRVFERFYRIDASRSRELGGTGLGLSIVKHLVERMGGSVRLEPNEPRGSVFIVTLPHAEQAA